MFGPTEGKRHDAFMLGVSGLADKLRRFQRPNGEPCVMYGDPASGLSRNILAPYRRVRLTDDEQNEMMCRTGIWQDLSALCISGF